MAEAKREVNHQQAKRIVRVHPNGNHGVEVEFRYEIGTDAVVVRATCDEVMILSMNTNVGEFGLVNQDEVEIGFAGAHYVDDSGIFDMGTAADTLSEVAVEMLRMNASMMKFWNVLRTIYDLEFIHEAGALAWEQKKS